MGSHLASVTMGWSVTGIVAKGKELVEPQFLLYIPNGKGLGELTMGVSIPISSFAFNAPLTLAILAALHPIVSYSKRALSEALLFMVGVHLLYCYSSCALQLLEGPEEAGVVLSQALLSRLWWEFLYGFTENMLVRFEPFLVAAYIWLRTGNIMKYTAEPSH